MYKSVTFEQFNVPLVNKSITFFQQQQQTLKEKYHWDFTKFIYLLSI